MGSSITRRDWMLLSAAAGGTIGLAGPGNTDPAQAQPLPAGGAAALPPAEYKLGMVTYQMGKDMTCDQLIELCRKTGLAGVELRTTHAHKVEDSLSAAERAEIRVKFADAGVAIAGLGTAFEFHSRNENKVRENIEGSKSYAKLAADIGAKGIKVRPNGVERGDDPEKAFERIGKALGEVARYAADLGVEVWLEVHGNEHTKNTANIAKIIRHAGHPNAKVCWNSNQGETDASGSIRASFDQVRDFIGEVHINEIGRPIYPWRELFDLLREIRFSGFCLAEIEYNPEPERFMRYYRTIFECLTDQYRDPRG
ncbi:MAG TPA: sugar phosphate isomerase/epimerase family protein [Candidatus Hydrogenedentes bacterium]|nr:sugar phosphate isomerase/epimerase family protein [Candidatus Hydrogenedentota bacterium]